MILGVLVGNTTVRFGLLEGAGIRLRGVIPIPPAGLPLPAGWEPREEVQAVVAASVNPGRLAEVLAALKNPRRPVIVVGRDLPVPIVNRYQDPNEVGIDRLLNALAASRLYPGRGVVVLDFGTALSVSVVSPAGEFLGGPIAAGLAALAAGLSVRTAQLPEVLPEHAPERLVAASTREAIAAGIYCQVAGAASRILEGLAAELSFAFIAIATGGDASLIAPAVGRIERIDPDLALRGLAAAYAVAGASGRR